MKWRQLDPELWFADYRVPGLPCRTTAVDIGGRWLVFSPGESLAPSFAEEVSAQPPILLAPNSLHHMGINSWREQFGVGCYAAAAARKRLGRHGHRDVLDSRTISLSSGRELVEVPHSRIGETWVIIRTDQQCTWVIGDAVFNFARASGKFWTAAMQRVLQSGPDLAVSSVYSWGAVRDRASYKRWFLERLEAHPPTRLIPTHGSIESGSDLAERLALLIDRRF